MTLGRNGNQNRVLAGAMLGYAADGYDLMMLAFIVEAISTELGLTREEAGFLVTSTLISSVAGGIIFGFLSDIIGRVRVLVWTILLFAVFTALCAFSESYWDLLGYRVIAGLGLGGEFGIGMALVTETWPDKMRARASSYVALGWQGGVLVAALLTPLLLPLVGWRGMFLTGLAPAIIAVIIRASVRESKLFLELRLYNRGKHSMMMSFQNKKIKVVTVGMVIMCSIQGFGYYGLMIWLPSYLSNRLNYGITKSSLWTAVIILGMAAGIFIFGHLSDRFGRRPIFVAYQAAAAIMVFVYAHLSTEWALLFGGAAMGFAVNGMLGGYGTLISELYPTEIRATAQNVISNVGRIAGAVGPVVVGRISSLYSDEVAIELLASIYIVDIVATILLIPETKGTILYNTKTLQ